MANNGTRCPSCGELAVFYQSGDVDCLAQSVCEACGVVVEDISLIHHQPFADSGLGGSGISNDYNTLPDIFYLRNSKKKPKLLGLRKLKEVGQALTFTPAMIEEAEVMFKTTYYCEHIRCVHRHVKETVALSCLYIVGRIHSWPIVKSCVASTGQRMLKEIVEYVKIVARLNGIKITTPDIEDLVPVQVREWGLPESLIPAVFDLIHLLRSTWLAEGATKSKIIQACLYITYMAHKYKKGSTTPLAFSLFSKEIKPKQSLSRSTIVMINKIINLLVDLATKVPWLGPKVSKKHVFHHFDDILAYQQTLLHDVIKLSKETSVDSEESSDEEPTDEPITSLDKGEQSPTDCESPQITDLENKPTSITHQRKPVSNKRKRKLAEDVFTPESYRISRQKSAESALKPKEKEVPFVYLGDINSTELNEHDLTDQEFKTYTRNEEEILVLHGLQ